MGEHITLGQRAGARGAPEHRLPLFQHQSVSQDVVHMLDQGDGETLADLHWHIIEVPLVLFRNEHMGNVASSRRQQLLGKAADGQYPTAQGDLTGHRQLVPDRHLQQGGDQGGGNGDTRRRTVLGNGPFRHMDMDIELLIEVGGQTEQLAPRPHVA